MENSNINLVKIKFINFFLIIIKILVIFIFIPKVPINLLDSLFLPKLILKLKINHFFTHNYLSCIYAYKILMIVESIDLLFKI